MFLTKNSIVRALYAILIILQLYSEYFTTYSSTIFTRVIAWVVR